MSADRPTIGLYLKVSDVGERGGIVAVRWAAEGDDVGHVYMASDLDNAADRLKPILWRLMYGADRPPTT